MNFKSFLSAAVIVAFISLVAFGYFKQEHSHSHVSSATSQTHSKEEVEKIVKGYLTENPEVLEEAMRNLYNKRAKVEAERSAKIIKEKTKELEEDPQSPKAGNINPKVKIVEFFDYNCGYCKHMLPTKKRILEELKDVQIIFKELPILGENSKLCAKAALAVNMIDSNKYFDYHSELLTYAGDKTPQILEDLAKKIGVDIAKYKTALNNPDIEKHLNDNVQLATVVGIRGTPAYVVAGQLVPGAISFEEIKERVEKTK